MVANVYPMQKKIAGPKMVVLPMSGHMRSVDQMKMFDETANRFLHQRGNGARGEIELSPECK